jgi:hypothetical protein
MNIATWLRSLGLEQYEQVFRDNAIDDEIILSLNDTELALLGIRPLGTARNFCEPSQPWEVRLQNRDRQPLSQTGRRIPTRSVV